MADFDFSALIWRDDLVICSQFIFFDDKKINNNALNPDAGRLESVSSCFHLQRNSRVNGERVILH